jgi:predicted dehydrogenase
VIEARDFLRAIETGAPVWPTFREGHAVNRVIEAALASAAAGGWVEVAGAGAAA